MGRPGNIFVEYDGSDAGRRALDRAASLAGYGSVVTVVLAAAGLLDEARERLVSRHVAALYVEPAGDPAEALVEKARELEADLVVSASPAVVDGAPCDVLIVR